ncbi:hypothetical protein [Methylobacterium sp. SI9]|uniref:hypothetical protein n=1 Tax=Methylobacterium guangdongense TaxID=3138811 RepID=UPI00313F0B43
MSAHLFVDMLHDERRPGIYRAIVEETPTLGRSYIQSVIHKVLRHAEYDYKDRNGATKTTFTICALEGYKSAKIENALKAGTVPFVELVRKAKLSGFDTEGFIPKEQKQKVLIRKEGSSPLEKIKALKDWALQHEWDEVRVQVRLPDQRSRLVTLGREDDAASVLFVRAEQVYVESDLDVCCENVEPQLMEEALKIFAKDWGMQTKV